MGRIVQRERKTAGPREPVNLDEELPVALGVLKGTILASSAMDAYGYKTHSGVWYRVMIVLREAVNQGRVKLVENDEDIQA